MGVTKEGSGGFPQPGDTVFVHYTGKLPDGKVFDSSIGKPHRELFGFYFELGAGAVIGGWDKGVATMKKGEKAVLTCKPDYAYGAEGTPGGPIPPNATLIFEVELKDFRKCTPAEVDDMDRKVAAARG